MLSPSGCSGHEARSKNNALWTYIDMLGEKKAGLNSNSNLIIAGIEYDRKSMVLGQKSLCFALSENTTKECFVKAQQRSLSEKTSISIHAHRNVKYSSSYMHSVIQFSALIPTRLLSAKIYLYRYINSCPQWQLMHQSLTKFSPTSKYCATNKEML